MQLIADVHKNYNHFSTRLNSLSDYVEINIAGFRKLMKQRIKQFSALQSHPSLPINTSITPMDTSPISYHNLMVEDHVGLIKYAQMCYLSFHDFLSIKI